MLKDFDSQADKFDQDDPFNLKPKRQYNPLTDLSQEESDPLSPFGVIPLRPVEPKKQPMIEDFDPARRRQRENRNPLLGPMSEDGFDQNDPFGLHPKEPKGPFGI
jgi:hypothetical protein